MGLTIGPKIFNSDDLAKIDPRFLNFIKNYVITEIDNGKLVTIPDVVPFNYFEDLDKGGDVTQYEKQLSLWCGWAGRDSQGNINGLYDAEVVINLRIQGKDTVTPTSNIVTAEILKSGSDYMKVIFNNHFLTDFTSKFWIFSVSDGYQVISNMFNFL